MRPNDSSTEPLIRKRQNHKNSTDDRSVMEAREEHEIRKRFKIIYGTIWAIGITLVVLLLVWLIHFRGGFTWQSDPKLQFNWHPLLMVLGLICVHSQSILLFRSGKNLAKYQLKFIHMSLNVVAFVLAGVGLKASFDSHNLVDPPIPNLYTVHSWIGLVTIILYSIEFLGGFAAFLFPRFPPDIRAYILPVHTAIGKAIFLFVITTCVTGFLEKAIFTLQNDYKERPPEAYIINFMGLLLTMLGALVLYIVNAPEYQRVNIPEDQYSLGSHAE